MERDNLFFALYIPPPPSGVPQQPTVQLSAERERERKRESERERQHGEGQGRINGCALIDKLIKQTKTSTHIKTQTECKADTLEYSRPDMEGLKERKKPAELSG